MILCDTTVLIDILRKKPNVLLFLKKNLKESLFTTEISVMENYFGIYSNNYLLNNPKTLEKRIKVISELLHHFIVLPFDRKAAIKTAQIMGNLQISGHMIDFRDGMIAGISIANSIINLVSSNVKHFKRIPDVTILEY